MRRLTPVNTGCQILKLQLVESRKKYQTSSNLMPYSLSICQVVLKDNAFLNDIFHNLMLSSLLYSLRNV